MVTRNVIFVTRECVFLDAFWCSKLLCINLDSTVTLKYKLFYLYNGLKRQNKPAEFTFFCL